MKNPLFDLEFLKALDKTQHKEVFAKIILLTFDEQPIEEIQGRITQGSINVDGNSAVRRTCSLTMVTNNVDIEETYWTLKNKFKLEVGVWNNINPDYPDIIWFKQGLFVFSSINMNVQAQNYTITLQGKDKMVMLNGELGGTIMAQTDFGTIEEYETLGSGEIIRNIKDQPIIDIVKNMVHLYAGQPLEKIILNDVESYGLELLEYRGDNPIWMLREDGGMVTNVIINKKQKYYCLDINDNIAVNNVDKKNCFNLAEIGNENNNAWTFYSLEDTAREKSYNLIRLDKYDTCGYRLTDLTYPGELIANVGESIVNVLDKIKGMFSDFEYFFDLDGYFVFQKKKTYVNTTWNPIMNQEDQTYVADAAYTSSIAYSFENGVLLSAFSGAPQIANIRNDFSIWGKRKSSTGAELPIHMRYAIDFKPEYYKPVRYYRDLDGNFGPGPSAENPDIWQSYPKDTKDEDKVPVQMNVPPYVSSAYDPGDKELEPGTAIVDWREIIYQMALDFYAFDYRIEDFKQQIALNNPIHYPTGKTGYENYYMDLTINSGWRDVYYPLIDIEADINKLIIKAQREYKIGNMTYDKYTQRCTDIFNQRLKYYLEFQHYVENSTEAAQINEDTLNIQEDVNVFPTCEYINCVKNEDEKNINWSITVSEYPENLNFWFDFLDVDNAELSKYAVSAIGCRPKAKNNDKVKAIYYKATPDVLFLTTKEQKQLEEDRESFSDMTGYTFIRLTSQLENYFIISAQGISAQDELDSLLYQHTYATDNITLTTVPIYYLQPNNRVFINDKDTGVNGEFIVTKITIPLQYNGTSSFTVSRAVDRIY